MIGWIIDNIILRFRKYGYITVEDATVHLHSRIVTDSFYYVKSEGYITGNMRFKRAKIEDFILAANVSDKNQPKVKLKSIDTQLLSSPGNKDVLPSDPVKEHKVIGEWRTATIPEPTDAEDEKIYKKIENSKRRYYLLAVINKADYSYKKERKYWVTFYLYSWKWRKRLGNILINNKNLKSTKVQKG